MAYRNSNLSVLLVGPHPGDRLESIERFIKCLERELSPILHTEVLRPRPALSRFAAGKARKWFSYADKFILFPNELARAAGRFDLVHFCDQSLAVYLDEHASRPQLITCHDLLAIRSARGEFREHRTGFLGRKLQAKILSSLKKADYIACISSSTRRDVLRLAEFPEERVRLVPMGPHRPSSAAAPRVANQRVTKFIPQTPFILHVGGTQWYKNRRAVVPLFAALRSRASGPLNLVLVGKPPEPEILRLIRANNLQDSVLSISDCTDEDLEQLYSAAKLLLFPSLFEGFGWPILEAQLCGCPVVTTNREPMTEVAGEGAIFIDPANIEASVGAILPLLKETATERALRKAAGFRNAARFSTDRMVEAYVALYTQLAGCRRSSNAEHFAPA
ncbi:MAG TPA: glycosyltransferase family 1 protein [Verrucomicrobiae bacterium]|nr:glycosyltransferase family 1 protein [Verrucomicrobiae bacterium]